MRLKLQPALQLSLELTKLAVSSSPLLLLMPGNFILGVSGERAVWKEGARECETWKVFSWMLADQEVRSSRASHPPSSLFLAWHHFTAQGHQNFNDRVFAWCPHTSDPLCLVFSWPSSSIPVKQKSLGVCQSGPSSGRWWPYRVSTGLVEPQFGASEEIPCSKDEAL